MAHKTAEEYLAGKGLTTSEEFNACFLEDTIEAMQEYARQVAEAVKKECKNKLKSVIIEDEESSYDENFNEGLYTGMNALDTINIEQYIK